MTTAFDRLPVELRAGTRLDWRAGNCREIIGPQPLQPQREMVHGYIDERQRTYQGGGEFRDFYFRKFGLLTLDGDVWEQIKDACEWIEMIDHELNHCWRIRTPVAREQGYYYEQGIGPRYGVPQRFWNRSSGPVERERPEPPPEPLQRKLF